MQRPLPRQVGRVLAATLGIPALLLGSLTASALTTGAATGGPAVDPAVGPTVKTSVDEGECDKIRFGTTTRTTTRANAISGGTTTAGMVAYTAASHSNRFPTAGH